jgi:hypothetical protein
MSSASRRGDETSPSTAPPPRGFVRFVVGKATVVCARHVVDGVRAALEHGTLYHFAERNPRGRAMSGRGVVYAVPLLDDVEQVVIRHNHHGGLFAGITRDLFPLFTRAPRELETSERLRAVRIPTPVMLGYAEYEAFPGVYRADVMSREVEHSFDLSVAITSTDNGLRVRALHATASLVRSLVNAGAWHKDLNVKNVLLHPTAGDGLEAMVLDVDRVTFPDSTHDIRELNVARLMRSARKWQLNQGACVTDAELGELASLIRKRPSPPPLTAS